MDTTFLKIRGMSCQSCVAHTKKALEKVPGVREANVSLDGGGQALVLHEGAGTPELVQAVVAEGYEAGEVLS
jgi:mercuric reductase